MQSHKSQASIQSSASRAIQRPPAYDKNLKPKIQVNISTFSFLLSQIIKYLLEESQQLKKEGKNQLEFDAMLQQFAHPLGAKVLQLAAFREKGNKQDLKIIQILQFVHNNVWKTLFGRQANGLQQSYADEQPGDQNKNGDDTSNGMNDQFRIIDNNVATDKFISGSSINASSFIAGIIEGLLIAAEFPAKVTSVRYDDSTAAADGGRKVTMFIIKFAQSVIQRQDLLSNKISFK